VAEIEPGHLVPVFDQPAEGDLGKSLGLGPIRPFPFRPSIPGSPGEETEDPGPQLPGKYAPARRLE
jgi:hypothetical protein